MIPLFALLPLLTACGHLSLDDTGTCGAQGSTIAACVVAAGSSPGDTGAVPDSLELSSAIVVGHGTGAPPEGCVLPEAWTGEVEADLSAADVAWIVVEDDAGARYTVALAFADLSLLPDTGTVSLSWTHEPFVPFNGQYGLSRLSLRDGDGLLAWQEEAGSVADMDLPTEVGLSRGAEACRSEESCGTRVEYALELALAGQHTTVAPDSAGSLAGFAYAAQAEWVLEDLQCSETAGAGSRFALARQ